MSVENYSADQRFQVVRIGSGEIIAFDSDTFVNMNGEPYFHDDLDSEMEAFPDHLITRTYLGQDRDDKPVHAGDVCCHVDDQGYENEDVGRFIVEWNAEEFAYQVRYLEPQFKGSPCLTEHLLEYKLSEIRVLGNCWMRDFKEWQR